MLYTGNLNWDCLELPSNLSIFFCADAPLGASSSYQSKALMSILKKIDESDITKLIKQKIMLPAGVFKAIMMLKNYLSLTELLFNEKSRLPIMIESWVDHILSNMRVYQFAHEADTNLCCQSFSESTRQLAYSFALAKKRNKQAILIPWCLT